MTEQPDLPGDLLALPGDLAGADRLTPYAAALRYGLGNPEAVAANSALRWAALAIEWADTEIHPENDATADQDA